MFNIAQTLEIQMLIAQSLQNIRNNKLTKRIKLENYKSIKTLQKLTKRNGKYKMHEAIGKKQKQHKQTRLRKLRKARNYGNNVLAFRSFLKLCVFFVSPMVSYLLKWFQLFCWFVFVFLRFLCFCIFQVIDFVI